MKMIGYVDGIEVSFDFFPPNHFKATIPKQIDGTYIIQLRAIDDAGNFTNFSNVFVKIDFDKLSINILPDSYQHKEDDSSIFVDQCPLDYNFKEIDNRYLTREVTPIFTYKELIS